MSNKTPPRPISAAQNGNPNIPATDALTRIAVSMEGIETLLSDLMPLLIRITIAYELQVISGLENAGVDVARRLQGVDDPTSGQDDDPLAHIPESERYRFK